tara:strand:+ start:77 stop:265 length:189 start_codon:yes stop_codon:yes gene_type:complete
MENFLINCVISNVENETTAIFDSLMEDDSFKQLAIKLCKNINENNYSDISRKLSEYANNNLI